MMIPPVTVLFAAVFLVAPPVLLRLLGTSPRIRYHLWLVAASAAVAVSWSIPSPILSDYTSTFSQHLVGGGVSAACVAYYFMAHMNLPTWRHRLLFVTMVVATLGVGNEVVELGLDFVRDTGLRRDASFDLFANTLGGIGTWAIAELARSR